MIDVAHFIGSDSGSAPSDATKDRRILAWLADFPHDVQAEWAACAGIIRYPDRLVESEIGVVSGFRFDMFRRAVVEYLAALDEYTRPGLLIRTLEEHKEMLLRLGGGAFRVLPYYDARHWDDIGAFGALDQFWNNVRDLQLDLDQGLCYVPGRLLTELGLPSAAPWPGHPGHRELMTYWLDEYEPQVRARAQPFIEATGLHPSWERFRAERLADYARIEQLFREVDFDYVEFARGYWG